MNNSFSNIPKIIYGTAWKEEKTARLVCQALEAGFRAIDTANQRKHYCEALVGQAILDSGIEREQLWIQTKFTQPGGQDHRIPYALTESPSEQVSQSFSSSLEHLHTTYLDSYILHGPSSSGSLSEVDLEIWNAMERLKREGKALSIGVSNFSAAQLNQLLSVAQIQPASVQNRCIFRHNWDLVIRGVCKEHSIQYQGFWLLTGNQEIVQLPDIQNLARQIGATPQQLVYRIAMEAGIIPLTGTTSELHMKEALAAQHLEIPEHVKSLAPLQGLFEV